VTEVLVSVAPAEPVAAEPGFIRRLLRRPLAVASLTFLNLAVLSAVFAPVLAPYSPTELDLSNVLSGPTWAHPFGTDDLGRDVLSRIMYGGRVTLVGAAIGVTVAFAVGVSAGLVAGYVDGWFDNAVNRVADMALAIPHIIILLVVLSVFGRNEKIAMVTFGLLVSPTAMRIIRGSTLAVRHELFVDAARVSGLTTRQIIVRHIVPRVSGAVIVLVSLISASAVLVETGLGFLGLGVPPPTPSWGELVAVASTQVHTQPWLLVPSGLLVAVSVLSFGLLGDAARDASTEGWQARTPQGRGPRRRAVVESAEAAVAERAEAEIQVPTGSLLSVRDLIVEFATPAGPVRVVDGVSFDVRRGDALALVGESGCGKSITARALIGLLPPGGYVAGGSCLFGGRDTVRLEAHALRKIRGSEIALVSQNAIACLDPVFTVRSQLGELVRIHEPRISRVAETARVRELLEMVHLPDPGAVARRYPHELSGGMAQRVAIAAALAGRPQLLIADEPTTALDVTLQAEILDLLCELQERTGMAILMISHDWGVVADLCRHAIVMYAGQVLEAADIEAIFEQPLHPYTAGLLLSNPQLGRPRQRLSAIPGAIPPPGRWPHGCRFHPRCSYATLECQLGPIPLLEHEQSRVARCIHSDQLRAKVSV